jgi:1-acyl-sn-glycerol-3-phosphate acyltransferase
MTKNSMSVCSTCESGCGAVAKGVARVLGFFGLIILLTPLQVLSRFWGGLDPFTMPRLFHRCTVRLLGFKVRVRGTMTDSRPVLFVSNHSSYLDVPVLGSIIPAAFVAKSEVAGWPLVGALARLQRTVFIERRAQRAGVQRDGMRRRLQQNHSIILFPEGTSSDGMRTLPFKSSLFSIVETALSNGNTVTVQPVSLVCTELGGLPIGRAWRPFYAWYGDMTFIPHFWNVFKLGHFTVDVIFHPPVTITEFADRKALAVFCRGVIAKGVEECLTGRHSG